MVRLLSEAEIAKIAGATKKKGASKEGLIKAAKHFGFQAFSKEKSSPKDLLFLETLLLRV